jgi:hypothetical protein
MERQSARNEMKARVQQVVTSNASYQMPPHFAPENNANLANFIV